VISPTKVIVLLPEDGAEVIVELANC